MSSSPTNSASDEAHPPDRPISSSTKRKQQHSGKDSPGENQIESGEGGNNSDNSSGGIMSIGNNSFGFNFDNEEALSAGRNSSGSGGENNSNNEDDNSDGRKSDSSHFSNTFNAKMSSAAIMSKESRTTTGLSSLTTSSSPGRSNNATKNADYGNNANTTTTITLSSTSKVASRSSGELSLSSDIPTNEESRKRRKTPEDHARGEDVTSNALLAAMAESCGQANSTSNMYDCGIDDSGGYSDHESVTTSQQDDFSKSGLGGHRRKKKLDTNKREERNHREKERSFRISKQITELRDLLSNGGVVVPKGTKSSVLTEAANYIRMLQQHQYRSEMYVE
jgi:Helix-loop-helix DNA-binding domain